MNRYHELSKILDEGRYFKVVCGAGNEDPVEVYKLSIVYVLAGALGIDISANVDVVKACMAGIDKAIEIAPELGIKIETRPFINVSVGLAGDPHVRKAEINLELCTECGQCMENCDQVAINESPYQVVSQRCIGCGKCSDVCEFEAITYYTKKVDFNDILPKCMDAGAENIELHAIIPDDEKVLHDWNIVSKYAPEQFISMCLDRSYLSDHHLINRIREAKDVAGERLIIQADGAPMSGGPDSYNTTLQAVAIADIVQKSKIDLKLLLSGGTNSKTGELSNLCDLTVSGVSIGTFARNLVRDEITNENFENDIELITKAVKKGKELVDINLNSISRES